MRKAVQLNVEFYTLVDQSYTSQLLKLMPFIIAGLRLDIIGYTLLGRYITTPI